MSSAELMQLDVGIRERSMFSARTTLEDYLQSISDKVETILNPQTVQRETPGGGTRPVTEGLDVATARLELKQELQRLGYEPDPAKRGSIEDLSSDRRIDLVIKTNVEMAQGYGQWRQGQETLEAFPAQELFRAEDREEPRDWLTRWQGAGGRLYGGRMIALKDDPIWEEISAFGQPYPPFDFNSGMWVRDVSREEALSLGVLEEGEEVAAQRRGFELEVISNQ